MCCIVTDLDFFEVIPDNKAGRAIYDKILKVIPVGMTWHKYSQGYGDFKSAIGDKKLDEMVNSRVQLQLGTLGSGNHFAEIGRNTANKLTVTLHSGSRKPGWWLGQYYMNLTKKEDRHLPTGFLDLKSEFGQAYVQDLAFALEYALENRRAMMNAILCILDLSTKEIIRLMTKEMINENHNHAIVNDDGTVLHRKGATPAEKGVRGVIPGNILTGTVITEGLGNEKFLSSASHGAGRAASRKAAKKAFVDDPKLMEEMEERMKDIICPRLFNIRDELPHAYKDLDRVLSYQEGVVIKVIDRITPKIVVKGEEEKKRGKKSRKG